MSWSHYAFEVGRLASHAAIRANAFAIYNWWQAGISPEVAARWAEARGSAA